jgi:hypothetical protein
LQLLGQMRKAPQKLLGVRCFSTAGAEQQLVADQVEDGLGVAGQGRRLCQQALGAHAVALAPALGLVTQQLGQLGERTG